MFYILICLIFVLCSFFYRLVTRKYNYWKSKNVPFLKPTFLFGNYKDFILLRKCSHEIAQEILKRFPDEPIIGSYYGTEPALLIQDPEIISLVLVKDFYYFNGREVSNYSDKEFVTQSMFFTSGDSWKLARYNLSSAFSPTKMKNMFYLIQKCCVTFENYLKKETSISIKNVNDLIAKYTMDGVGSCVFGVDIGLMDENASANNPFEVMSKKIFQTSFFGGFKYMCRSIWPAVFYGVGLQQYDKQLCNFFRTFLKNVFSHRETQQTCRNDFIDFLLKWKNEKHISSPRLTKDNTDTPESISAEVTEDLLIGQCILFFGASYHTSASTMSYALFELSKHKSVQAKVLKEVDEYFATNCTLNFECVNQMVYLDACINETLRMYPLLGILLREVMEEYTFPNGLKLEKGLRIHIPVYHIQHNPKFYPNPEIFQPERFLGDNKKNLGSPTFLSFGLGPKMCIGARLAKIMIVACLATIFKNYELELPDDMPRTLKFEPKAFNTTQVGNIHLKFIPRKNRNV